MVKAQYIFSDNFQRQLPKAEKHYTNRIYLPLLTKKFSSSTLKHNSSQTEGWRQKQFQSTDSLTDLAHGDKQMKKQNFDCQTESVTE